MSKHKVKYLFVLWWKMYMRFDISFHTAQKVRGNGVSQNCGTSICCCHLQQHNQNTGNNFNSTFWTKVIWTFNFTNLTGKNSNLWNNKADKLRKKLSLNQLIKTFLTFYRHHRLRIRQPTRCIKYPTFYFAIKLHMFRASSVPIIRSYLPYARPLVRFMQAMWLLPSRVRLELQSSSNLTLLGSGHIACMKRTNGRAYGR